MDDEAYPEYNGKLIGFVVHTKNGFKPFVGRPMNSPGDNDSVVTVVGSQDVQPTLELALACFDQDKTTEFALIMQKAVPPGGEMGHWLEYMLSFQA